MSRGDTLLAILYHCRFRRSLLITVAVQVGSLGAAGSGLSIGTLMTLTFGGQCLLLIHWTILLTFGRARRASSVVAPCR